MAAEINITSSNDDENDKLNSELDRAINNNDELEKRLLETEKKNKDLENQVKRQTTRYKKPASKQVSRFKRPNKDKPSKPIPTEKELVGLPFEESVDYVSSIDSLNVKRQAPVEDVLISSQDEMNELLNSMDPNSVKLDDAQIAALTKLSTGGKGNVTDALLEARIDNLYRTLSSDKFKEQFVTQDPFFQKLSRKAESALTPEELNQLTENEQNKQLSSISQFDTKLSNSLNLIRATIEARLESMEAAKEPDVERIGKYEDFQANINDIQKQVNEFVQQASDTLREKTYATAKQGYDVGAKDREAKDLEQQIKEAEKRGKQADKIIQEFDKEFQKYMNAQREQIANQAAFAFGQQAINEGKSTREARLIYQNALTFFRENIQTPSHTFTPEEIEAAYAAEGGTFQGFNFSNNPKVPSPQLPPGFSPPSGPGAPPGSEQGTSQFGPGNQQNVSNLIGPPGNPPLPNVISPRDLASIVSFLLIPLRDIITEPLLQASRLGVKATSAERSRPVDLTNALAAGVRPSVDFAGALTGAGLGFAGGIAGVAGGLPGMIAGAAIGEQIAEMIPMEQYAEMIGLLYEINANIAKNSEAFSPELLQTSLELQLNKLDQNIYVAQKYGADIADIQSATNELTLLIYEEFVKFIVVVKPALLRILEILAAIVAVISLAAQQTAKFQWTYTNIAAYITEAAIILSKFGKNRNKKKRDLDFTNQANQNIPFDIG